MFKRECPQAVEVIELFLLTKQIEVRSVQVLCSDATYNNQEPHTDDIACLFWLSMIIYLTPGTKKTMFYPLQLLGADVVNKINRVRLSQCDFMLPNEIDADIKEV